MYLIYCFLAYPLYEIAYNIMLIVLLVISLILLKIFISFKDLIVLAYM
ncbi:hypothetical protein HanRHA438_Chr03g0130531 [Helianthus annuus]|nr:hypothetical protein HanRHA438_Chr03g0130531 [Helianthus annuus]